MSKHTEIETHSSKENNTKIKNITKLNVQDKFISFKAVSIIFEVAVSVQLESTLIYINNFISIHNPKANTIIIEWKYERITLNTKNAILVFKLFGA